MDLGLVGKAAVVTAASQGIGKGIAEELAKEGTNVAICARGRENLEIKPRKRSERTERRS